MSFLEGVQQKEKCISDILKENGEYEKRAMGKFPDSNEFNKDKPQV